MTRKATFHKTRGCVKCRKPTRQICDHPRADYSGMTCCAAVCERCATKHEHRNLCPAHAAMSGNEYLRACSARAPEAP